MKGHFIYCVYSINLKTNSRNPVFYTSKNGRAYAYAIAINPELEAVGRHAEVQAIWVQDE